MLNASYYKLNDGGRFDATRLKLALFDRATVQDIIDLVNFAGQGLINDIFKNSTQADPDRPLAILSPAFMTYSDMPAVISGLAAMIMGNLRKPKMGNDQYAELLSTAYSLPTLMAKYYADKIETYDKIIADANQDGNTSLAEQFGQYSNLLAEGARRIVNSLATATGANTLINWDQDQDYDLDMLFELAQLGEVVALLNQRNRFIKGQAQITGSMNLLLNTGDPSDDPQSIADALVGDVFAAAGRRRLPKELYGHNADSYRSAENAGLEGAKALLNRAGLTINSQGQVVHSANSAQGDPYLRNAIGDVLTGAPASPAMLAAAQGVNPFQKLFSLLKEMTTGDPLSTGLYGDIAHTYGSPLADAWLTGDVDGVLAHALINADKDVNTDDSTRRLLATELGDHEYEGAMSPEMGGLFRRIRENFALRRHENVTRRQKNRASRFAGRQNQRRNIADLNRTRRESSMADYYEQPETMTSQRESFEPMDEPVYDPMSFGSFSADGNGGGED